MGLFQITVESETDDQVLLTLHGDLAGIGVEILAREGKRYRQMGTRLTLQLDHTHYIDEAGLALLRRWQGRKLELRGGTAFIKALLAAEGLHTKQ